MFSMTMLQGVYVNGTARAPGERIEASEYEAHELAINGWAMFDRPTDAGRAQKVFVEEQMAAVRYCEAEHHVPPGWPFPRRGRQSR